MLAGPGRAYLERPEELKYILSPVLCRTTVEQGEFYRIFDAYLIDVAKWQTEEAVPVRKGRGGWWIAGILIGIGLLAALAMWWTADYRTESGQLILGFDPPEQTQVREGDTLTFLNYSRFADDSASVSYRWQLVDVGSGEIDLVDSQNYHLSYVVPPVLDTFYRKEITLWMVPPEGDSSISWTRTGPDDIDTIHWVETSAYAYSVRCRNEPAAEKITGLPQNNLARGEAVDLSVQLSERLSMAGGALPWTYSWEFGDGATATTPRVSHVYEQAGIHRLRLTVRDTTSGALCERVLEGRIKVGNQGVVLPPVAYLSLPPVYATKLRTWVWWAVPLFWLGIVGGLLARFRNKPPEEEEEPASPLAAPPVDRAPYYVPWQQREEAISTGPALFRLAESLRLRQDGLRPRLNLPDSLQATVRAGGFPKLRYSLNRSPTEYLILIDEESHLSHQGRLFHYLADKLRGQDVYAEIYFYRSQLNRFWNRDTPSGVDLDQLSRRYGRHRLLLLGDVRELLDPGATTTPRLRPDLLANLRCWSHRYLLTPVPPVSWTYREKLLAEDFNLFPADTAGFLAAADHIKAGDVETNESHAAHLKRLTARRHDSDTEYRRWKRLKDYTDYLQPHPGLTTWFSALAAYPRPDWNLTLAIGQALEKEGGNDVAVTYDNLLRLARIPTLNEGRFSPRLRREMLAALPENLETLARNTVAAELLAVRAAAAGGAAMSEVESELAVQQFALDPADETARKMIAELLREGRLTPAQRADLDGLVAKEQPEPEPVPEPQPNVADYRNTKMDYSNVSQSTYEPLTVTPEATEPPPPVKLEEYFDLEQPPPPAEEEWIPRWLLQTIGVSVILLVLGLYGMHRYNEQLVVPESAGVEENVSFRFRKVDDTWLVNNEMTNAESIEYHRAALELLTGEAGSETGKAESLLRDVLGRETGVGRQIVSANLQRLYYNRGAKHLNHYQRERQQSKVELDSAGIAFQAGNRERINLNAYPIDTSDQVNIQESLINRHGAALVAYYRYAGTAVLTSDLYTVPYRLLDS
ncbi:MAG: PKD domain-containing protein, partial [Saprospiraceae bacterium]